jgi:putative heme-binding domain-containing protein
VALARMNGRDEHHRKDSDAKPELALQGQMLAALDRINWEKLETSDRLDLMRAYELVVIRLGSPDSGARERLAAKFDALFPAATKELNIHLANMLVYLEAPSAATKTMALLRSALTQEEQIEYMLALRALKTGWTMPLREEYFQWFVTKGASYRGGNTFAAALRTIKSEAAKTLTADELAALKPILEAAPERLSPEQMLAGRKLVKEWSMNELVALLESGLTGGRDFERGRKLYSDVACAACHRFDQDGGSVGPDLTAVAGRFNVRDLLESIVEPSKVISDQYGAIVIETKDGRVITGRVGNLSGESLQVIENMLDPGRFTLVRRSDIESIEPSNVSMMPKDLLNTLTAEEIQDLFAYLLARGDRNHAMFRARTAAP